MTFENTSQNDTLVEQIVTYHIEIDRRFLHNRIVSVMVNVETDEHNFASETVESLQ